MKAAVLGLALLSGSFALARAQSKSTPMPLAEVAATLYTGFNPATKTVTCAASPIVGQACPYATGYTAERFTRASIDINKEFTAGSGPSRQLLVVTTLLPFHGPSACHSCGPSTGIGIYRWAQGRWALESKSAFASTQGEWGDAPEVHLAQVGPQTYGVLLDADFTRDYESHSSLLFAGVSGRVEKVWESAYSFRQLVPDGSGEDEPMHAEVHFHFQREAISHGLYNIAERRRSREPSSRGVLIAQHWHRVYRFNGSRYRAEKR